MRVRPLGRFILIWFIHSFLISINRNLTSCKFMSLRSSFFVRESSNSLLAVISFPELENTMVCSNAE